ncbi:hypothetical protein P9112_009016 [Eukaryota sp. TZLM1-RC]
MATSRYHDSDNDDGFDSEELLLSIHKTRVDGSSEALAVQRLISSLQGQTNSKQSAIDAALLFLSEVNLSTTEAQLAFVYFDGVPTILSLVPSLSSKSCTAAANILASCASHPLVQNTAASHNAIVVLGQRLSNDDTLMMSPKLDVDQITSLLDAMAKISFNTAANRKSLRAPLTIQDSSRIPKKCSLGLALYLLQSCCTVLTRKGHVTTRHQRDPDPLLLKLDSLDAFKIGSSVCRLFESAFKNKKNIQLFKSLDGLKALQKLFNSLASRQRDGHDENLEMISSLLLPLVKCLSLLVKNCSGIEDFYNEKTFNNLVSLLEPNIDFNIRLASTAVLRFLLSSKKELNTLLKGKKDNNSLSHIVTLLGQLASSFGQSSNQSNINQSLVDGLEHLLSCCSVASIDSEIAKSFIECKLVMHLANLVNSSNSNAQILACKCICYISRHHPIGPQAIKNANILPMLIKCLLSTQNDLLIPVTAALASLGQDKDCAKIMTELDALRLLWSLFRSSNDLVKSNAAAAAVPLLSLENVETIGRTFIGGLELLLGLLTVDDVTLVCNGCMAVSKVAKSEGNLKVITEDGVVPLLARLVGIATSLEISVDDGLIFDPSAPDNFTDLSITDIRAPPIDGGLSRALCEAITVVCSLPANRVRFAHLSAVTPLVKFLKDPRPTVLRACSEALSQLAKAEKNSLELRVAGAVPLLVKLLGSDYDKIQEAAAEATGYIRKIYIQNN